LGTSATDDSSIAIGDSVTAGFDLREFPVQNFDVKTAEFRHFLRIAQQQYCRKFYCGAGILSCSSY
jgi:hypothetical protein